MLVLANGIAWLGKALMICGIGAVALIFLVAIFFGWPETLEPVRSIAATVSDYVGPLVWLVWLAVFVGPGFALSEIGDLWAERLGR